MKSLINFVTRHEILFLLGHSVLYWTGHKSPCCVAVFGNSINITKVGFMLFLRIKVLVNNIKGDRHKFFTIY